MTNEQPSVNRHTATSHPLNRLRLYLGSVFLVFFGVVLAGMLIQVLGTVGLGMGIGVCGLFLYFAAKQFTRLW